MGHLADEVVHLLPGYAVVPEGDGEDLCVVQVLSNVDKPLCQVPLLVHKQEAAHVRPARREGPQGGKELLTVVRVDPVVSDLREGKAQTLQDLRACRWPGWRASRVRGMEKLSGEKMMFLPGFAATIRLCRLLAKWGLFRKVEEANGFTGVG